MADRPENDEALTSGANKTPPPVLTGEEETETPAEERASRTRVSHDETEALAAWDAETDFPELEDLGDAPAAELPAEPPAPDSADLVLDVSDEPAGAIPGEPPQEAEATSPAPSDDSLSITIDDGPAPGPNAFSGGFAGDLPREPFEFSLDAEALGFRPEASAFRPHAIAQSIAGEVEAAAVDVDALRAELGFLSAELALLSPEAAPADVARVTLAAARAAERVGDTAAAESFYQRARAAVADHPAALRGQLRLAFRNGEIAKVRALAEALAHAVPADAVAYRAVVNELDRAETGATPDAELSAAVAATEAALRASDPAAVIAGSERLATVLDGEAGVVLRAFVAAARELEGTASPVADAAAAPANTLAALARLRQALTAAPAEALTRVAAAAEALPSSPLSPALWSWAARLARGTGDRKAAQRFLDRARGAGAAVLAVQEGVDLAGDDLVGGPLPPLAELTERLERVPPETSALLAARLASALVGESRGADAVAIVRRACERDPDSGPALAPVLTAVIAAGPDQCAADDARQCLVAHDPSRRAAAQIDLLLAAAGNPDTRHSALDDLAAGLAAHPDPALSWWLAWQLRSADRQGEAAAALETASAGFAARAGALATALRARAGVLDAAANPTAFAASLPVPRLAEAVADDPAALARALLDLGSDPKAIATTFKAAAAVDGVERAHEAAGWLVQAGAFPEALALLADGDLGDPVRLRFLRRLARLGHDPAAGAALLRRLAEVTPQLGEQALYQQLAAELVDQSGKKSEAAAVYLELLAGPLAKEADLALRRALLAERNAEGLFNYWRDEFDACSGAGRDRAAAAAALEKARVALDLTDDHRLAAAEITTALGLDADSLPARVLALCQLPALGGQEPRLRELERLSQDLAGQGASAGFFAALVADGEGETESAVRLLAAAAAKIKGPAPLALMRRYVGALLARGAAEVDLAGALAGAAARIAETPGTDPRLPTTVFLRAAEVAEAGGQLHRAEELAERARALCPDDLPTLARLARLQTERGDYGVALRHLETLADNLRDPSRRAATLYTAGVIASDQVGDEVRARVLFGRALEIEPRHEAAFARYRKLIENAGDHTALASLLAKRVQAVEPQDAVALRLERATLLLGKLNDRLGAKRELGNVLALDPDNLVALGALSGLELEDGANAAAAELALRQSRIERDPDRLTECLLRLGRIYRTTGGDAALAIDAYERVLGIDEGSREALEALSELYAGKGEARLGINVTERLLERENEPARRRVLLVRLGLMWESAGDVRRAGVALRQAAEQAPRDITVIGELVRFHERHDDAAARRILLDGSIALMRNDFRARREPLTALRTLIPLFQWRGRPTAALSAAQLLVRLSPDTHERAEAAALVLSISGSRSGLSLSELGGDERALPRELPPGLAHVLKLLGPTLVRNIKPDLRRFDVGRNERQGRTSAVRAPFESVAVALGIRDFDVYLTRLANAMGVEPSDPPSFVVGVGIAAMGAGALKFAAAFCGRLYQTHFSFLLRDGPIEAAAFVAAIVRQAIPEHRPPYLPEGALKAAEARVSKAVNRSLRSQLGPLATQLAGGCSPEELYTAALEVGARVGLIACGDLIAALDVLAAFAGRPDASFDALLDLPLIAHLIDFALSDEHDALVAALEAGPIAAA